MCCFFWHKVKYFFYFQWYEPVKHFPMSLFLLFVLFLLLPPFWTLIPFLWLKSQSVIKPLNFSCDTTVETAYKQQCKTIKDVECRIVNLEDTSGHHISKKLCEDVPQEKCVPVPFKVIDVMLFVSRQNNFWFI